jgi:hypothetical protein
MCVTVTLAIAWGLTPQVAWSWGRNGHKIVGKIAELRLSDKAKKALAQITDLSLADDQIANWADKIAHMPGFQGTYKFNNLWHFVDIPFDADEYDPDREAQAVAKRLNLPLEKVGTKNNVIEQIEIWKKVLADPNETLFKRKTALRFLVHFLGDIHQPLHCANRNDAGGNAVQVIYLGIFDPHVKLHQVWDDNLVNEVQGELEPEVLAFKLNQTIEQQGKAADWEAVTTPKEWAKESHGLAKKFAYPPVIDQKWDTKHQPVRLEMDYVKACKPVVETQLMKAGVRLAKLLNEALEASASP